MEKRSRKTIKNFNSRMQARLLLVFCIVSLMLAALMARLIFLTQTKGDQYAKQVLSRQSYVSSVLPYKRGDIIDRNGTVLATSELHYRLILDSNRLNLNPDYIETTGEALKDSFGIENETFQKVLTDKPDSQYVIMLKNLKYDEVKAFETLMEDDNAKIVGVWFEEEYVRTYPFETLACDVLGFTSTDNTGYWGLEEKYNSELNGTNGRVYGYYDSELNLERTVKKAVNGNSIITTIDANVQRIVQENIIEFNEEFGSKGIGVLIMDPNDGGIIAMASNQEYDLNNPRDLSVLYTEAELTAMTEDQKMEALNTLWKNDVISFSFEPGSTFKPVTIAAAMEEGLISEDDIYFCDGGEQVGDKYIHCSKRSGHGELTLGQALMVSCNDAMMQIAAKEGKDTFFNYQASFGLGAKTGIDLPGEEVGLLFSYDKLGTMELATSSFGQGFISTMVQMGAAFSSLVNGGNYYQPHVLKEIVNDSGATVKEYEKLLVRQTVSEETSEFMQKYLYQTVEAGTASGAKVEGYSVGGKTGTAQKLPREAKTYIVSFLGCSPAVNPEIVIYVMIDEPQNVVKQADSSIATKFAAKILNEALPALGIYPEGDIDYLLPEEEDNTQGAKSGTGTAINNPASTADPTSTEATENGSEDNQTTEEENTESAESSEHTENEEGTAGSENEQEANSGDTAGDETDPGAGEDAEGTTGGDNQEGADGAGVTEEDEFNPDALD